MSAPEGSRLAATLAEAQRVLAICNACRYCEGYCAVFPALERRLSFDEADIHYLGSLCHNCGSCLYACQYAPPHEFRLDFPRVMAEVRGETYRKYATPAALGATLAELLDPAANAEMQTELAALRPPTDIDPAERAAQAVLETAGWP
jgi:Fe-S oxidoreductase